MRRRTYRRPLYSEMNGIIQMMNLVSSFGIVLSVLIILSLLAYLAYRMNQKFHIL